MKKIIGILLALSLVLSLAVMTMPVAAKVKGVHVDVYDTNCACSYGTYNITFNITASLTEGYNNVCVKFPAGTTVPTTFKTGDITINGVDVFAEEITVTGTQVCFLVPEHLTTANNTIEVIFKKIADIINPCTPGKTYQLEVWTDRPADATPVKSNKYEIVPCLETYGFTWDSGPTYPGIAKGFVPPFKKCGQNETDGAENAVWNDDLMNGDGGYMNAFNLTFGVTKAGCNPPCTDNVTLYMSLVAAPQYPCDADPAANVTINLTDPDGNFDFATDVLTFNECVDDEPEEIELVDSLDLDDTAITWEGLIHFDTVGTYQIDLWATCPSAPGAPCQPPAAGEDTKFAETSLVFEVYQWKSAYNITLREKWNLISLPLVPLEDDISVDDALASIPKADRDNIESIWYYDRCEDEWLVWGNGQSSLTSLDDGEAYWVRLDYPLTGCGNVTWWVWGTPKPVPPASPAEYPVCEGWNMVGFTSLSPMFPSAYLWQYTAAPSPVVYGWDQGCWTSQGWNLITFGSENMVPGQGYWVAFPADGAVYVP